MMDHSIEINEMTIGNSTNSTVENQKNSVNREPWAEKLTTRLEDECKSWTPPNPVPNAIPKQNASIFKLRYNQDDEELYKVCAIGIGPYNHHKSGLLFSDTEKRDTVMLSARVYRIDFKTFFSEISPKINEVRACYAEGSFELDDEALSEMLFFDGCFIICAIMVLSRGLLFSTWNKRMNREEEPLINACKSLVRKLNQKAREVMADLLMLENQIPYFVIHILWEHCFLDINFDGVLFKDVALACFDDLYPRRSKSRVSSQFSDCLHLLDLFHWSRSPINRFREIATYSQPGLYISTVTELQASSVNFKKSASDCSLLDIIFSERFFRTKGVIFIPEINLYAYSRRIFQNLIAFEQAYRLRGYGFTAYVECMAQLVQTEKDVSLLRSSGIIASTPVTDIGVVDFFRTIRAGVQLEEMPPDLYELYEQVKDHVEHRPHFPNKWITISMFSVSIFALSLLQALYSMLGYYAPTNGH